MTANLKKFLMEKINELNNNCMNKDYQDFHKWTISDIYDYDTHQIQFRDFCCCGFGTFDLCEKCKKILDDIDICNKNGQLDQLNKIPTLEDVYDLLLKLSSDIKEIRSML
jgi:hypothetical protein